MHPLREWCIELLKRKVTHMNNYSVTSNHYFEGYFKMHRLHISLEGNKASDLLVRNALKSNAINPDTANESEIVFALNQLLLLKDLPTLLDNDLTPHLLPKNTLNLLNKYKAKAPLTEQEILCLNKGLLDSLYPFKSAPQIIQYIDYLNTQDYDLSTTLTFTPCVSVYTAKKKLRTFLKYLNSYEIKFYHNVIFYSAFYEKGEEGKRTHIHLLLKGLNFDYLKEFEVLCDEYFGESIVEPVHSGSIAYVARKSISKDLLNFDLRKMISARKNKPNKNFPYKGLTTALNNTGLRLLKKAQKHL